MIFSKIKKHLSLLYIQLNENKTLQSMLLENDPILDIIVESFKRFKINKIHSQDKTVFKNRAEYRNSLLNNQNIISFKIFGTNKVMTVKEVCKKASSPSVWGKFFYLITKSFKSPFILEVGTNLGVSGSFFLEAIKDKKDSFFTTMEGVQDLCEIASNEFNSIVSSEKYHIYNGLYEKTFPKLLETKDKFNIVFIDGNHNKKSTLQYYNSLKSKLKQPSIIIFDDIHWSSDMEDAWAIIKRDKSVSYSIDFYKLGVVIIKSKKSAYNVDYYLHLSY
ncbi:class I SAM-dependent methyltransferase [Flavobacteriales bacterium]|nr:class I SAM-dependent methyltransferase [Flavobacteriales bacterium]